MKLFSIVFIACLLALAVTVSAAESKLIVSEVNIGQVYVGESFKPLFSIRNDGDYTFQGPITARLYIDNKVFETFSFEASIKNGETQNFQFSKPQKIDKEGVYEIMANISYTSSNADGSQTSAFYYKSNIFSIGEKPQSVAPVNLDSLKDSGTDTDTTIIKTTTQNDLNVLFDLIPLFIILAFIILIAVVIFRFMKHDEAVKGPSEIEQLILKKKDLQETIEMTKVNYYKRKIDEAGLQKTLKDSQDEIFLINQKIKKLKE